MLAMFAAIGSDKMDCWETETMAGIEQFVIDCDCGAPMTVGVHQCGLDAACPKCRKTMRVPDLKKLRAQSGDPYPTLASIRKIQKAISDRLAPLMVAA